MSATIRPANSRRPGQVQTSGNIAALNGSVELAINGQDTVVFEVLSNNWTGTIQFQQFQEGSGWGALATIGLINGTFPTGGNSTTSGRVATAYCGSATAVRAVATAWTSGSAPINIRAVRTTEGLIPVSVIGATTSTGSAARGTAVSGNPLLQGFRAATAAPVPVTDGQVIEALSTIYGSQVITPWSIPELTWSFASAAGGITTTADTVLATAPGAGLRRYVNSLSLSNNSATGTEVVIRSGASTVLARLHLPGNAPNAPITFQSPLRGNAAEALNIACATAGAAVYANAQGFTAP